MTKPAAPPDAASARRRSVLRGASRDQQRQVVVEQRDRSTRAKSRRWQTTTGRLKAVAADPELHRIAAWLDQQTASDAKIGGRPRHYPTAVMLAYGAAIPIFKSANAVANNLADPDLWAMFCNATRPMLEPGTVLPTTGPSRHHWDYFLKHRLAPNRAGAVAEFGKGAARLARDLGLADPDTLSVNRLDRLHSVVTDGKVFTSPLGTREVSTVDKATGEIRTVRQDPGRGRHHEGGDERNYVWGCKYAISSIRATIQGVRVVVGFQHIATDGRGEAGAFVDLAVAIARELPGVSGFITDGALRGEHIDTIQTATGAAVVVPPRRKTGTRGGMKIGDTYYAARVLPESKARTREFAQCGGHDLWVAGGHLVQRIITSDGSQTYQLVERVGRKRQAKKDGTWSILALHRLPCEQTGLVHEWHEYLTRTEHDRALGFNRAEYLRSLPAQDPDFDRVYGFRSDSESLNAQLEYDWHKQRIPAWGEPNQTSLVLLALMGQNAWARHAWQREVDDPAGARAGAPPTAAA